MNDITMWRIPACLVLGFLIQAMYLPGTSKGKLDGVVGIVCMCVGTLAAYWRWYR